MKRVITASLLVPIALYSIYWAPQSVFIAVAIAFALLCFYEYNALVAAHGIHPPGPLGYVLGLAMFLDQAPVRLIGLAALIGSLRMRDLAKALPYAAATLLGAVYIFGAWRAAVDLRAISAHWLFFALAINWVGDIAAYYVGRAVGRRKLAPRISPGKSWEGALGSLAGALVFGYGFYRLVQPPESLPVVLFLSAVANAAGQVGDLAESAIKRGAGVKDSGTLLPGHGGFLDRLDSSLFSMPAVYYALRYTILFLTK